MNWQPGNQAGKLRDPRPIYEELEKLEGDLSEEDAIYYLIKFLKENPSFATQLIMGVRLYPFQHIMVKSMMNADYFLGVLSRGLSKCIHINELCFTQNGLIKIDDIKIGDQIFSDKTYNVVKNKWYNPEEDGLEVTITGDISFKAKMGHKLKTLNEDSCKLDYQLIEELKVGQYLPVRLGMNYWPQSCDEKVVKYCNDRNISLEDFWLFCGIMIGDGHYKQARGLFSVTSEDWEVLNFILDFASKNGNTVNPSKHTENSYSISFVNQKLNDLFRHLGFTEDFQSDRKFIPQKLTAAPSNLVAKLLAGLFLTDGYCAVQEKPIKNSRTITLGYTSICEGMIKQVQALLLNFGIFSSKHVVHKGGKFEIMGVSCNTKKAWCLNIGTYGHLKRFQEFIGFGPLKRKNDLLKNGLDSRVHKNDFFGENIPCIGPYLMKKYKIKSFVMPSKEKPFFKVELDRTICRSKLVALLGNKRIEEVDKQLIRDLIDERYVFKKIKSIAPVKVKTLDITVDSEECYWSNGLVHHNSYSAGIFAALYAILNPNVKIGILSKTFRQAKGIIQKILDIAKKPEGQILASTITSTKYATDLWQVDFGTSSIVALPLGDGSRIRGFRFQCIIVDEFLLMPENIYKEVIIPFLGVVNNPTEREDLRIAEEQLVAKGLMKKEDCHKWPNNKLIALSSASYEFEYLYKLYSNYCNAILKPKTEYKIDEKEAGKADATRVVVQLGYGAAPADLYDKSALDQARAEMSLAQMEREYGSIFTSDSSGYYRIKKIEEVSLKGDSTPCVEIRGDPLARYIVSIDPSWAGSEASDDWALTVLKLNEELKISTMVHGYAMPGTGLKSHIDYFVYILENFNVCFVIGDYNGGKQFMDAYNESEAVRSKKMQIEIISGCDFNDAEKFWDDVKTFKREYNLQNRKMCYLKTPTSSWIRHANELLSGSIENKKIWFANEARNVPNVYWDAVNSNLDVQHLNFMVDDVELSKEDVVTPETKRIDLIENCYDIILLTKKQLALIEIKTTPQGTQTFDLNQGAKRTTGPNRQRKDSYSALLLGVWGHRIFLEAENFKQELANETFLPFFA